MGDDADDWVEAWGYEGRYEVTRSGRRIRSLSTGRLMKVRNGTVVVRGRRVPLQALLPPRHGDGHGDGDGHVDGDGDGDGHGDGGHGDIRHTFLTVLCACFCILARAIGIILSAVCILVASLYMFVIFSRLRQS